MPPRPALRIDHARVTCARPDSRRRLEQVLAAATPAATGVPDGALLLVRRLRLNAPLSAPPDRAAAALIDQLRDVRRAPGAGDLYLDHPDAADLLLVGAALSGKRPHPLLIAHLADAAQPLIRWRRHLLPDPARLPALLERLAQAGLTHWLARFESGELAAAALRLLPSAAPSPSPSAGAAMANRKSASPPLPAAAAAAIAQARAPGLPPAAQSLLATALIARHQPHLLALPAVQAALAPQPGHVWTPPHTSPPHAPPARHRRAGAGAPPAAAANPLPPESWPEPPEITPPFQRLPATAGAPPESCGHTPDTAAPATDAVATVPATLRFTSAHAGLFFLVPAFTALGLYGDFTQPQIGLPGLSPFGLLWWLGRHWRGRRFLADPLAPWLRQAAGLGQREAVTRWFLPPEPVAPNRWLTAQARRLHTRLADALGNPDPLALLLAQPGEIIVADDRLTLSFPLAGHPLPLRLAGLDRDPGFLPAAGRTFRFDFSC